MSPHHARALLVALTSVLVTPIRTTARAQDSTSSAAPTQAIYSDGQAEKGKKTFGKSCAACHETFFFTGIRFEDAWVGHPVFELWDRIQSTMPQDKPGSLSKQQYADVVAYILKLNGYPAGKDALPGDPEALKMIVIEARPKGSGER